MCAESRARRSAPGGSPPAVTVTGASPRPVAPIPENHATRAKSYAPGTEGGGGGISRARRLTVAPRASPAGTSFAARLTRTRGGRSGRPTGASRTRTSSRAGSCSTRSTRAVIVTSAGRASTGAATRSARHHTKAHPAAIASAPISAARPARPPLDIASPISASAPLATRNQRQSCASGSTNHAAIPAPSATGSHRISWSRSASSQRSIPDEIWPSSRAPPI